ncbi:MAG TPA: hypothetical protein VGQ00_04305 [Candidatus Norongarragalinales archaeon]|jgi:hypothetical protein|nr:hypothetical protein [Candidatus Norongarragalinales archaeon]
MPPAAATSTAQKKITLSLSIDEGLQHRVPFLLLLLLLFVVGCVMFVRANFSVADAFDLGRYDVVIEKLYSVSFILFLIIFSLAMAIAAFYGSALERMQALLVLPLTFVPALVMWLVFPNHVLAFIAFSLTLSTASYLASRYHSTSSMEAEQKAISQALLVLVVLTLIFTFARVSAQRDAYFDQMLSSATGLIPGVSGESAAAGLTSLCSGANFSVSQSAVRDKISRDMVYQEMVRANASYGGAPSGDLREIPLSACHDAVPVLVSNFIANYSSSFSQQTTPPASGNASNASQATPTTPPSTSILRTAALNLAPLKAFYDNMAFIMALVALSLVTLVSYVVRGLSYGFYWLLLKI